MTSVFTFKVVNKSCVGGGSAWERWAKSNVLKKRWLVCRLEALLICKALALCLSVLALSFMVCTVVIGLLLIRYLPQYKLFKVLSYLLAAGKFLLRVVQQKIRLYKWKTVKLTYCGKSSN